MKTRTIIGAAMFFAGLLLAVCTGDGSAHETALRLSGVALIAMGGYVGDMFDKSEELKK